MPASLVVSARSAWVAVFLTATAAAGTTAPLGSVMVPLMVPAPVVCAERLAARKAAHKKNDKLILSIGNLHPKTKTT